MSLAFVTCDTCRKWGVDGLPAWWFESLASVTTKGKGKMPKSSLIYKNSRNSNRKWSSKKLKPNGWGVREKFENYELVGITDIWLTIVRHWCPSQHWQLAASMHGWFRSQNDARHCALLIALLMAQAPVYLFCNSTYGWSHHILYIVHNYFFPTRRFSPSHGPPTDDDDNDDESGNYIIDDADEVDKWQLQNGVIGRPRGFLCMEDTESVGKGERSSSSSSRITRPPTRIS